MKALRTLAPAAAPLGMRELVEGFAALFGGPRAVARLQDELRAYWRVKHVFLVSSGKAALTLILSALKALSPRREVMIPAYTCFSVPSAIARAGLDVSLCDLDPLTFDFDYQRLEAAVGAQTLCVISSHLFGIPADMDRIASLCRDKGIYVVEDAAQAMGGTYRGRRLGAIGDVGFFSLGRGKNITCGSGGVILTNEDRIAEAVAARYSELREPGVAETARVLLAAALMAAFIRPRLYWLPASLPFLGLGETVYDPGFPIKRLSNAQAALLRGWRDRLEQANRERAEAGSYYRQHLRPTGDRLDDAPIPYLRFPVLAGSRQERDRVFASSRRKGLGVSVMYPCGIHQIEAARERFDGRRYRVAEAIAERLLALPTHRFVSERDRSRICRLVGESVLQTGDVAWAEPPLTLS